MNTVPVTTRCRSLRHAAEWCVGFLVIGAAGWLASPVDGAEASRPNIVVVLLDDLGWSDIGCYGKAFGRLEGRWQRLLLVIHTLRVTY